MTWRNHAHRAPRLFMPQPKHACKCPDMDDFDWIELCKWVSKRYKNQYKNYSYLMNKIMMKFGIRGEPDDGRWGQFFDTLEDIGLIYKVDRSTIIVADFSSLRL